MKQFIIGTNDINQRLDKFVSKAVPLLPKSLLYKYLRTKRIKINGKKCDISTKLQLDDIIQMYINDEFFETQEYQYDFLKASTDIDIIFEDDNIMLINKPQGLVVHEDNEHTDDTLINRALHYLYDKHFYNPTEENSFIPALCNRIDRNTCGIVILAKNFIALQELNLIIKNREIEKKYMCIVHGTPNPLEATLKDYMIKNADDNLVKVYSKPSNNTKTIITKYKVIKSNDRFSLAEILLITGRTHQIRAHMAFIGHPLLGDTKYGLNKNNKGTGYKYQALCSYKLKFKINNTTSPLFYLNEKDFEIKNISFVNDFLSGKIK